MNVTNSTDCGGINYFIATYYLLLSAPGIVVYSTAFFILITKYKQLNSTFYLLPIALAISDILTLCSTGFYAVPSIYICDYFISKMAPYVFGWLTHACFYNQITLMFIIACNRFVCMKSATFQKYDELFTTKRTLAYICGSFCFSVLMTVMMNCLTCFSTFSQKGYYFGYFCSDQKLGQIANILNAVYNNCLIFATALIYMISWINMRVKKVTVSSSSTEVLGMNNNRAAQGVRKKAESKLFLQFIVISSVLILNQLSFYVLPLIVSNQTATTIITGTLYIALCSMKGYLHLFSNSFIRSECKTLISKLKCKCH